ncbi:hypothetical protein SXIM_28380 [Streptomyces xiamenensis]|uniref:Uncharacterized protein n=1 Tax=Streptomyces xiamenensis TaxID=408015 RepID=A0A0F7FW74_9ACTN|nr:hypothetical protein SXIM_28380 [Streptomyces xiamenensis]
MVGRGTGKHVEIVEDENEVSRGARLPHHRSPVVGPGGTPPCRRVAGQRAGTWRWRS